MGRCEVCEVDIPEGDEAKERHEAGKKHMKSVERHEMLISLKKRSIFVKMEYKDGQQHLSLSEVRSPMEKFGAIDRIIYRPEDNFAIVEFADEVGAEKALALKRIQAGEVFLHFNARKMQFSDAASYEKHQIDISRVILDCSTIAGFSDQIDYIVSEITLPTNELERRQCVAKELETVLQEYFISPSVTVFGSSVTTIGTKDSDVDACFELKPSPTKCETRDKFKLLTANAVTFRTTKITAEEMHHLSAADRARLLCKVLNEVRKEVGWVGHQRPVLDARCPVVRFVAHKQMLMDLSVDNRLGCAKSFYLKRLLEADSSGNLRRLLVAFRVWALSNGLLEPSAGEHKGHFNAYMLNLLLLRYLQSQNLVPVLAFSEKEVKANGWRIDYVIPEYSLNVDLQQTLKEFFVHVIEAHLKEMVYSAANEGILNRNDFNQRFVACAPDFKFGHINVQDPLEQSHNVCQNVTEKSAKMMKTKMMLSLSMMKKQKGSFSVILGLTDRPSSAVQRALVAKDFHVTAKLTSIPESVPFQDVKNVIEKILEEMLYFVDEDNVADLPAKRRKEVEEDRTEDSQTIWLSPVYHVCYEMWIGRRKVRRQLMQEKEQLPHLSTNMDFEFETSKRLKMLTTARDLARLQMAVFVDDDRKLNIAFKLVSGPATQADVTNVCHFVQQVLENNCISLFLSSNDKGEEQAMMTD